LATSARFSPEVWQKVAATWLMQSVVEFGWKEDGGGGGIP